jgi:hypothetical protein
MSSSTVSVLTVIVGRRVIICEGDREILSKIRDLVIGKEYFTECSTFFNEEGNLILNDPSGCWRTKEDKDPSLALEELIGSVENEQFNVQYLS